MPELTLYPNAAARRGFALALTLAVAAGMVAAMPAAEATQQAATIAVGDEAPDFTLQSIDGETYRLADLRGDKKLVLVFFRGTW